MASTDVCVCCLSHQEVQLHTLADTPDDVIERHVDTVKEFFASHKVGVLAVVVLCRPALPTRLVQLKAEKKAVAEVETATSDSSESGEEEEGEEEEWEESDTGDLPGEQPARMVCLFCV